MKTVLEIYCDFKGWQGGTIHQAFDDFVNLSMTEKDRFCNKVFNIGLENVSDIATFASFTRARAGL